LNEDLPITPQTEGQQPKIAKIKYQPPPVPGSSRNSRSKPPGLYKGGSLRSSLDSLKSGKQGGVNQ
jgi:hypothetical protein